MEEQVTIDSAVGTTKTVLDTGQKVIKLTAPKAGVGLSQSVSATLGALAIIGAIISIVTFFAGIEEAKMKIKEGKQMIEKAKRDIIRAMSLIKTHILIYRQYRKNAIIYIKEYHRTLRKQYATILVATRQQIKEYADGLVEGVDGSDYRITIKVTAPKNIPFEGNGFELWKRTSYSEGKTLSATYSEGVWHATLSVLGYPRLKRLRTDEKTILSWIELCDYIEKGTITFIDGTIVIKSPQSMSNIVQEKVSKPIGTANEIERNILPEAKERATPKPPAPKPTPIDIGSVLAGAGAGLLVSGFNPIGALVGGAIGYVALSKKK